MFKKKNCKNCGEKLKENYEFCPSCGTRIKDKKENGMLGRRDFDDTQDPFFSDGNIGGFNPGFLGSMLNRTMKMLEKEMQKNFQESQKNPNTKFKLMVNGKEIDLNQNRKSKIEKAKKILPINFTKEKLEKFQKLKKDEPKSQIRRLGDKVTYELEVPGVTSIEDISIIKLENGLEIKALAKNKAYFKTIQINLPLIKYGLSKEKISLELDGRN